MSKIISVNSGSSSLKFQLFDMPSETVLSSGQAERIGQEMGAFTIKYNGEKKVQELPVPDHKTAVDILLKSLVENGIIKDLSEIDAAGHRIVQGGSYFDKSVVVDESVVEKVEELAELAPLHNPAHLVCYRAFVEALPSIRHVFVFDTAFHQTMTPESYLFPVPYEWYTDHKIRRYGAHGTSHRFVTQELAKVLGKDVNKVKAITCHLGNGSSVSAIENGKSVDTSMGLTPLQGVVMGTRSGDLDPTVVQFLCSHKKQSVDEVLNYLNKESGLLGVSGVSSDHREVTEAAEKGNKRAKLALDLLAYSVKKYVGMYLAVLNGADAIVFTGGIGENSAEAREQILENMENLGIIIDKEKNANFKRGQIELISTKESKVKVYIIPTNEELMMARDTLNIVKNLKKSK